MIRSRPSLPTSGTRPKSSAHAAPTLPGWQFTGRLCQGPRSILYVARPDGSSPQSPPDYVVKVLSPAAQSDPRAVCLLRREALVGRRVSHPHVVPVLAANLDHTPSFVVMPRIEGMTLQRVIQLAGCVPCNRALWIARQAAEGLEGLCRAGWTHGDVKPSNILVSAEGHVTLIDLGFARQLGQAARHRSQSLTGTLKYAAPESFVDSRVQDQRSDVYSLGITLHEMLTGSAPFDAEDPARLVRAHLQQRPPDPRRRTPHLPRDVAQLVLRMLAKEPMRRPQSPSELIDLLAAAEISSFSQCVP